MPHAYPQLLAQDPKPQTLEQYTHIPGLVPDVLNSITEIPGG